MRGSNASVLSESALLGDLSPADLRPEDRTMARVPDVVGLPVRTAARRLHEAGLRVELDGSGVVRKMVPEAGSMVSPGDTVRVASVVASADESEDD
ncbi:MAG TPA: hypothetical protein DCS76_11560 [Gemmatimonadetes bacterium]|nr:hypothetical protein [Gemmatimonadota bacterium]